MSGVLNTDRHLGLCTKCQLPMVPAKHEPTEDEVRHRGRGLCIDDYDRALRFGTLADHPRSTRSADEVLDDWVRLRNRGYTKAQAAAQLGMTHDALSAALTRARRRGDPRALPSLGVSSTAGRYGAGGRRDARGRWCR